MRAPLLGLQGNAVRYQLAKKVGRLMKSLLRLLRRNATSLPGFISLAIDPNFLQHGGKDVPSVLISGTNGKTSVTNLLCKILEQEKQGYVLCNAAGSNLTQGIASTLLTAHRITQQAVFEVDEANLPSVAAKLHPRLIILLNLFRDQMDRYGELDKTAHEWERLAATNHTNELLLNADDPNLGWLGQGHPRAFFFGIKNVSRRLANQDHSVLAHTADTIISPVSRELLIYRRVYFSHLGDYYDPKSDFTRPRLDYAIVDVDLFGLGGSRFRIIDRSGKEILRLQTRLPAIFNVYNVAAAAIAAHRMGVPRTDIEDTAKSFIGVFGRFETIELDSGRKLIIALTKNPTGFNLVLEFIRDHFAERYDLLIAINDLVADGTDVSWLWDVDTRLISPRAETIYASGLRAHQVALRLKYSGLASPIKVEPDLTTVVSNIVQQGHGTTICCLSYTAMTKFRSLLVASGVI